jgi:hypothetical protein
MILTGWPFNLDVWCLQELIKGQEDPTQPRKGFRNVIKNAKRRAKQE